MAFGRWHAVGLAVVLVTGCADGSGPGTRDGGGGGRLDGAMLDSGGGGGSDAGGDAGETDAAPLDAGFDGGFDSDGLTCSECAIDSDCDPGLVCARIGTGDRVCLPVCIIDLPDCPPRFNCVSDPTAMVSEPICAPVGERCCVDEDGDLYGVGIGCLGLDCNETSTAVHEGATEICDGTDNDCDGLVDEGDPNALCPRGEHVSRSRCSDIGVCENVECELGWGDCDSMPENGCETRTNTELHCGGCFIGCMLPNATGDCSSGTCGIGRCHDGWGDCNGDPRDGCETQLNSLTNCGRCGTACEPAFAIGDCSTGTCQIGTCNPRRGDCDGDARNGCETSTTTNADCGACNTLCAPTNAIGECSTGTCRIVTCTRSDYDDCDLDAINGCETSLRTNTDCSACGVMCSIPGGSSSCASGSCTLTGCPPGFGNCDGIAANGCEQPTNTNQHCGDCNTPCAPPNATGSCATGMCTITMCNPGWRDCDGNVANGCETAVNTLANCGACGAMCSLANADETCSTGMCRIDSCDLGWGNCDTNHANGCETSLRTNTNCNACGTTCTRPNGVTSCASGTCTLTGCLAGFSNCDTSTTNGCEVSHAASAGACGGGTNAGTYDGDRSCGFICGSNTGWDNFATYTGNTDRWFRARVREDSNCPADIEHRVRLTVPAGIDYDLHIYRATPCGTAVVSSTNRGNGIDETAIVRESESTASDDSFDYFVHVRYIGGAACGEYTIRFDGHNC